MLTNDYICALIKILFKIFNRIYARARESEINIYFSLRRFKQLLYISLFHMI